MQFASRCVAAEVTEAVAEPCYDFSISSRAFLPRLIRFMFRNYVNDRNQSVFGFDSSF
jgi:hypothetical protein